MSGIRGKNTKPEVLVRSLLHKRGFRFRLHRNDLPGRPDIVLPRYKAVIFVHGCFWHGHECALFRWPSSNPDFWRNKIQRNRERDALRLAELQSIGWRTLVIWECATRGGSQILMADLVEKVACWLNQSKNSCEIDAKDLNG